MSTYCSHTAREVGSIRGLKNTSAVPLAGLIQFAENGAREGQTKEGGRDRERKGGEKEDWQK